jgi:hypothetical protein
MANIELDGANKKITVDSGDLTLDIPGDIILDADGANVTFKDGGTSILDISNSSSDAVITSSVQDKDIIFKGDDNGSAITALTLDMSEAGAATFNSAITGGGLLTTGGNIVIPNAGNIGSASDTDAMAIASNGVVTFSQNPVFPDGGVAVADLDIDGATDIGADIVDADLFIIDDGAGGTNRKTAASRLKTYIGGGITMAQMWRLNTSFTGDEQPISSNLEAVDTDAQGNIGSAMTESSGIFTFPSTGYYLVSFNADFYLNAESRYNQAIIEVTENNSSYSEAGKSSGHINVMNSGNSGYSHAFTQVLLDVSNTTNIKVRFTVSVDNGSVNTAGNTDYNRTWMSFIRLGDT